MGAAVDDVILLDAMADDTAPAVRARRRELLYSAFEAVERVRLVCESDLKGLVVVVAALIASGHSEYLLGSEQAMRRDVPARYWVRVEAPANGL
jgi:hypothetical protein